MRCGCHVRLLDACEFFVPFALHFLRMLRFHLYIISTLIPKNFIFDVEPSDFNFCFEMVSSRGWAMNRELLNLWPKL